MTKAIDPPGLPGSNHTSYPAGFREANQQRRSRAWEIISDRATSA